MFPFEDVTYPMDMSAEQKCFDLGGGCKVKEFFCVKCACRSSDAMFFWEGGSSYNCTHDFYDGDGRCHHFEVDDQEELDKKRLILTIMLEDGVGAGGDGDALGEKKNQRTMLSKRLARWTHWRGARS